MRRTLSTSATTQCGDAPTFIGIIATQSPPCAFLNLDMDTVMKQGWYSVLVYLKILARTTFVLVSLPEAKNPGQDSILGHFVFGSSELMIKQSIYL